VQRFNEGTTMVKLQHLESFGWKLAEVAVGRTEGIR